MDIKVFNKNPYDQNSYLYYNPTTMAGIIIDPGLSKTQIIKAINDIKIEAIILTHSHFDHILSLEKVREITKAKVYIHSQEVPLLLDPLLNLSDPVGDSDKGISAQADVCLNEGDVITFAGASLKIIHTPGHTIGGMCLYDETNGVLFSGDTLFYGSIGRMDLPTGSEFQLINSIVQKLMLLPDATKVYSGHGIPTTIGHERKHNPFF